MALTSFVFMAGFIGGIFLAFYKHPFWGLCTYVAVYFLDPYNRWWMEYLPELRWSLVVAGATLLATLTRARPKHPSWLSHGPIVVFVIYVIWMWIQSPWVMTDVDHSLGLEIFTKYLVVLYLVYNLVDTRERFQAFLFVHVMGCLYLSLVAFATFKGGRLDGVGGSGIDDASALGMQLGTGVYCAGALYFSSKGWMKWASAAAIPFILNAVVMTGSRGAFLAVVCGGIALFVARPRGQTKKLAGYGFAAVLLFGYLASDLFIARVTGLGSAVDDISTLDDSAAGRIEIFKKQWQMAKDHPMGVGHKGTTWLSPQYLDEEYMSREGGRSSHNTFMSALVDQGFLGLLLWLMLVYMLLTRTLLLRRITIQNSDVIFGWLVCAVFSSLVVYWAAGMFAPLQKAEIYIWLIALVCSARYITEPAEDATLAG